MGGWGSRVLGMFFLLRFCSYGGLLLGWRDSPGVASLGLGWLGWVRLPWGLVVRGAGCRVVAVERVFRCLGVMAGREVVWWWGRSPRSVVDLVGVIG
jgi:hypothetical protein